MRWPKVTEFGLFVSLVLASCGGNRAVMPDGGSDVSIANDAGDVSFPQWWDPACTTAEGTCNLHTCRPGQIMEFTPPCGAMTTITAGCLSKETTTNGWGCWVRNSDGEVLQTLDVPLSFSGLQTCQEAGLTADYGFFDPQCSDGGGPAEGG